MKQKKNLLFLDHNWHFKVLRLQLVARSCVTIDRRCLCRLNKKRKYVKDVRNQGVGHEFMPTSKLSVEVAIFCRRENISDFDEKLEDEWIRLCVVDIHSHPKASKDKQVRDETKDVINCLLFAYNENFLLDFSPLFLEGWSRMDSTSALRLELTRLVYSSQLEV